VSSTSVVRPQASSAEVLRQQFAPEASDTDLAYFAQVARHLDVDPWAGHICLIPYSEGGTKVHRPQLTVAGRRFIAQRTGRLRGIVGPEWCGPRRFDRDGGRLPLEWLEVWDGDGPPYAARCLVIVDGWDRPANGTAKWSEFAQMTTDRRTGEVRPARSWERMPGHMLGKCAESLALRRAFSEVQAAVAYVGDDDDGAVMREVAAEAVAIGAGPGPSSEATKPEGPRPRARGDDSVPDWVRDQDPEARR
jgi:phage recombination protein Bet